MGATPLFALQELAGWEPNAWCGGMRHLAADHLAPYADGMGKTHGTFLAQAEKKMVAKDGIEPPTQGFSEIALTCIVF